MFLAAEPNLIAKSIGIVFLILSGLAIVVAIINIIFNKPLVLITEDGIEDKRLKLGIIPWEEIQRLEIRRIKGLDYLCMSLHHPDRFTPKSPSRVVRSGKVEKGTLPIELANLRPSGRAVKDYLWQNHPLLMEQMPRREGI